MEPSPLKATLLLITASLGISVPPADFLGSVVLALFGAALGAIWLEHISARERWLSVAAGVFGALLVLIAHEDFKPDWPVQFKAIVAGLIGRYLVAFMLQGAKQVLAQSGRIVSSLLRIRESSDD